MKNVWSDYIEATPKLLKMETNSRILQGISADENVVIVVMNIMVNETQGKISICIPAVTLDMIFKKKNAQSKKSVRRGDQLAEAQRRADIIQEISQSNLEMTGVLGSVEVLSKDLIELEVGDIIKLNKPEHEWVDVYVGDTAWFKGEMGSYKNKKAISIVNTIKRGSESAHDK
jgi:flagellar motor switch protein FliM